MPSDENILYDAENLQYPNILNPIYRVFEDHGHVHVFVAEAGLFVLLRKKNTTSE
jgi:hypothetical protein